MEWPANSARRLVPASLAETVRHVSRESGEYISVTDDLGYRGDPTLISALTADGLILPEADHIDGWAYYPIPKDAQSLSGLLNATSIDQRSSQKREIVFERIMEAFDTLAERGIAVNNLDGMTRHDICFDAQLNPILLPMGILFIKSSQEDATAVNNLSFKQLIADIITASPPHDIDYFVDLRRKIGM